MFHIISKIQTITKIEDNKLIDIEPCNERKVYGNKRKTPFSDLACSFGETKKCKL